MVKKIMVLLMSFVVGLFLIGVAQAQEFTVKQGDKEMSFAAGYSKIQFEGVDDLDVISLSGFLGYFFTDNFEGAINIEYLDMSITNIDLTGMGIGADIKYHFVTTGKAIPYIGVQYNYLDAEAGVGGLSVDGSASMYGPFVGLKIPVNSSVIISPEYQYDMFSGDLGDFIDGAHVFSIGISFKF
jgi:hypothetical protein